MRKIEALRNLLLWIRTLERVVGDMFLVTSNDAFQMANMYYGSVRVAARSNILGVMQIFQLLQMFWQRPRRPSEEPTIPATLRDVRGILRGTREGSVLVENECDSVAKGKRTIVDKTRKLPKGKRWRKCRMQNAECRERESAEFGELGEELGVRSEE